MSYQDSIKRCAERLQHRMVLTGASLQKMESPVVTLFLGNEAISFREEVEAVYKRCWLSEAGAVVTAENISESGTVTNLIYEATGRSDFRDGSKVNLFCYFSIMDDSFDLHFSNLQAELPVAKQLRINRFFFIFYRLNDYTKMDTVKMRVGKLTAWTKEAGEHVMLFSNLTGTGFLNASREAENYRAAADIAIVTASCRDGAHASALGFHLGQMPVSSVGYQSRGKDAEAISRVTLHEILSNYTALSQKKEGGAIAGAVLQTKAVVQLFDDLFKETIANVLPKDNKYLFYLPYTPAMEQFEQTLSGTAKGGLFGLRKQQGFKQDLAIGAKREIDPVYKAVLQQFYVGPAEAYLAEKLDDGMTGAERMRAQMDAYLISNANVEAMQNIGEMFEKIRKELPGFLRDPQEAVTMEDWFGRSLQNATKLQLYMNFTYTLEEEVKNLKSLGPIFEKNLETARKNLNMNGIDPSYVRAYGDLVHKYFSAYEGTLRGAIRPCETEDALFAQVERIFMDVIAKEDKYRLSFIDELHWRIEQSGEVIGSSVVEELYKVNVAASKRVNTYHDSGEGLLYSLISDESLIRDIALHDKGEVFEIPQSDYIERLYVYEVDPAQMIL